MSSSSVPDPDELGRVSKDAFDKAQDLVDELKIIQEHENAILSADTAGPVTPEAE